MIEWRRFLVPAILFAGIIAAYLHGHMGCSDSRWSVPTAVSLLDEHNVDLDEYDHLLKWRGYYFTERIGDHYYNVYPLGTPILATPVVAVLRPMARFVSHRWPSVWMSLEMSQADRGCPPAGGEPVVDLHSWTEQIAASIIVALTALVLYAIARGELPVGWSVVVALIFAFGTSSWSTASRSLWQHGPSMLMLAIALMVQASGRSLVIAGLALGFAYVVRPTNAIPLAVASAWVLATHPRQFVRYAVGAVAVLVPFFAFNRHIYHAWLSPYYHPETFHGNPFFWEALAGGFVSPSRGLFVYSPALIFAGLGIFLKLQQRRFTRLDASLVTTVLVYWVAIAWVNPAWWAGDSYGPRFSTDLLPYLTYWLIPVVGSLIGAAGRMRWAPTLVFCAAALVSVLMHAQGVLNPAAMAWNQEVPIDRDPTRLWDWRHPPFLAGFIAPAPAERPVDLRTVPCEQPPGAPTDLKIVSNSRNTLVGSWNRALGAVGDYVIESGSRSGASDFPSRDVPASPTPNVSVKRVPPGTYYARVRARNACGMSAPSNEILVTVQ